MDEHMSWGEAISAGWGNLTGVNDGDGSSRTFRWLFLFIFIAGTAWAIFNYIRTEELLQEQMRSPQPSAINPQADRTRLENMLNQVKAATQIRDNSPYIADSLTIVGKYPFGDPILPPEVVGDQTPVVVGPPVVEPVIIDYPPAVTVRAIMIMGAQRVAIMDIPQMSNGYGVLVKRGDTFLKQGRVMNILPDKVVIRWGGKTFNIAPGF
jgi:hypothetical protein